MPIRCLPYLVALIAAILSSYGSALTADAQSPAERDFKPRVLMKPIRPIVDASFIPASEVEDQVADNELVLGVVIGGRARAYPINMLTGPRREIINDRLGDHAIAATW